MRNRHTRQSNKTGATRLDPPDPHSKQTPNTLLRPNPRNTRLPRLLRRLKTRRRRSVVWRTPKPPTNRMANTIPPQNTTTVSIPDKPHRHNHKLGSGNGRTTDALDGSRKHSKPPTCACGIWLRQHPNRRVDLSPTCIQGKNRRTPDPGTGITHASLPSVTTSSLPRRRRNKSHGRSSIPLTRPLPR